MLRKIRILLAVACFAAITGLFLDFTGSLHPLFGWLARIQLLPALLAVNLGAVAALIVATLLFGRIYCSVLCPLGVLQDGAAALGKRARKNRYAYSPEKRWLRYGVFVLFVIALVAHVHAIVVLLAPYSTYGRFVRTLLAPLYRSGNNLLAGIAERMDSYALYPVENWLPGLLALLPLAVVAAVCLLAWRNGRTWCNTVCPVGTLLGFLARFSWLKPVIDTSKCNGCGLCARNCKAACIDPKNHTVDYSRCVACMDCLALCRKGAITYTHRRAAAPAKSAVQADKGRRNFLIGAGLLAAGAVRAQEKIKTDGGLAAIADQKIPDRKTPIVPPGAEGLKHFGIHCTACQLCVAACPNRVLRPSGDLTRLMQPECSYERGYCRPECTKCSEVCPARAIRKISPADKSATQIGHAVWIRENCVVLTDGVSCGNCARHCPSGAITMVPSDPQRPESPKIPAVNTERCIGCGACEHLCPARPFSAIYVEGHERHRTI